MMLILTASVQELEGAGGEDIDDDDGEEGSTLRVSNALSGLRDGPTRARAATVATPFRFRKFLQLLALTGCPAGEDARGSLQDPFNQITR